MTEENILQEEEIVNKTIVPEPNYIEEISQELELKTFQVDIVLSLIWEWATVPFIARYRKEVTWNLDEDAIRDIISLQDKKEKLHKAKQTAVNWIEEQWKLTPLLLENILKAKTLKEVEEIYKPFKLKKKTKAMIAIEKWFQVVADMIKQNKEYEIPLDLLEKYPREEILEWCKYIIGAEVSWNSDLRQDLLETLQEHWMIVSKIKWEKALEKLNEKDKWQISKFNIYSEFEARIKYLKEYQTLALNRGESLWILTIKIDKTEQTESWLRFHYARILDVRVPFIEELEAGFLEWYDALFISVENELRWILTEMAEDQAIETFQENLANLLMTRPEYWKKILAIDPWFAAWCKLAVLDEFGNPVLLNKIFLHKKAEAILILKDILKKEKPDVIVVWNWTWVNETIELLEELKSLVKDKIEIYIVNESWASVYSASDVAKEEFADLDSLDRWTISIWRRYIDPLSELVKVPVWSIWVWMYQHDMPEKKLEEKLWNVVEDVVNEIWINVNTASSYVLNYISWIDKRAAKKIFNNRPYKSRYDLKKQLSDKVYEQAIWFLRVPESKEKFDNTDIHPEQYDLAKYIIENNIRVEDFTKTEEKLKKLYPDTNKDTINFILKSYEEIWEEKRINSTHKKASFDSKTEVNVWDIIDWVVRNVLAFWAFVDIWMKNDWLVHISQIADTFIQDPKDFLEVGQNVRVRVTWIDESTWKIQLSMRGL